MSRVLGSDTRFDAVLTDPFDFSEYDVPVVTAPDPDDQGKEAGGLSVVESPGNFLIMP